MVSLRCPKVNYMHDAITSATGLMPSRLSVMALIVRALDSEHWVNGLPNWDQAWRIVPHSRTTITAGDWCRDTDHIDGNITAAIASYRTG